jgi:Transposase DDE domain group 1
VRSADGRRALLEPLIARYRGIVKRLYFRGDSAFADPEICEFLEAGGHRLHDPPAGQPGLARQDRIPAQAPSRATAARGSPGLRELRLSGAELAESSPRRSEGRMASRRALPRVGFIVTNLARSAERVVVFYNQRGTAEQWIKEGKGAIKWTRLSCRTFAAIAVRLQLHALA